MKKLIIIAALAASLGGCATQFGTRIDNAVHPHRHRIAKKAPEAAAAPAPVVVQAPAPAPVPEKPKSFMDRHPVEWLHH